MDGRALCSSSAESNGGLRCVKFKGEGEVAGKWLPHSLWNYFATIDWCEGEQH